MHQLKRKNAMAKTFILSDGSVNSYGFTVDMSKLNIDRFKQNPVMLYNHNELIGRWENIRIENGQLLAEPVFLEDEGETIALKVKNRVDKNFVKGASIGMHILSWNETEGEAPKVVAEVLETSIVDVPSNANALALYDSNGAKLDGKAFKLALQPLTQKQKTHKKDTMNLNAKTFTALGLDPAAKETEVDTAVQKIVQENADMSAKLQAAETAKVDELINGAITEGRLTADKKEQFQKLAASDFDLAKSMIADLPTKKTLSGKENQEAGAGEDRSSWSFDEFRKNDPAALLSMKKDQPEAYAKLCAQ